MKPYSPNCNQNIEEHKWRVGEVFISKCNTFLTEVPHPQIVVAIKDNKVVCIPTTSGKEATLRACRTEEGIYNGTPYSFYTVKPSDCPVAHDSYICASHAYVIDNDTLTRTSGRLVINRQAKKIVIDSCINAILSNPKVKSEVIDILQSLSE